MYPKPGCEAGEGHGPDLAGMGGDHALRSEAGEPPDFGEVFAVVHGVDDHQPAVERGTGTVRSSCSSRAAMRRAAGGESALTMTVSAAARTSTGPATASPAAGPAGQARRGVPESSARTAAFLRPARSGPCELRALTFRGSLLSQSRVASIIVPVPVDRPRRSGVARPAGAGRPLRGLRVAPEAQPTMVDEATARMYPAIRYQSPTLRRRGQ